MPSYPYALTLTNPGAETGDATGWTDVTGGPLASVTTQGGSTPRTGTRFFFAGAGATTEAYQLVTIPLDALADVDAGLLSARLTGYHSGLTDQGRLAVTFHNSGGTQIGPSIAQPWRASGVNEWLLRTLEAPIPVGARSLRFRLLGNRISGTNLDSYWDDLALALFVPVARIAIVSADTAHESALDNYNAITALGYSVTPFSDANSPNVDFTLYDLVGLIESALSVTDCLAIRAAGVPMFTDRGDQLRVWSAASFASDQNTGNTDVIASHPIAAGFIGPTSIQTGQTFRYYPLAAATVVGVVICTMDFSGTADARIENAVELGTLDTSGNAVPARIVANGWLRTTGISNNANGTAMLSAMVAWLLSGLPDAPTIIAVTNITATTAQADASPYDSPDLIPHQASQFRVRRSGALNVAHTSAVLGPVTTYTTPDNTLIPGRAYEFSAQYQDENDVWSGWGPWSTPFTTLDDELLPLCGATPAWMSVNNYMEDAWEDGTWICVGLGCNEGSALYGRPFDQGLPMHARVQKYEVHAGHNPNDPSTWIARARRTSSHVRARVGIGAAEVLLHPWGGQIDGFVGVCHSVTDDQGGDYGAVAGFRVGEINEGLGGCVDFGTPHDANIELYIFGPGGAVPVISTPIANFAALKGRLLTCGGAVCFRAIAPTEIDSVWLHEGGNDYYYRVEILGDVLEGTITLSQPLPGGYDGVALQTPGGGEELFLEFAAPTLTVAQPCELILQVFEDDRQTVAWEVGTSPAHALPYLCLPEHYGEQQIDVVNGAATIAQVEAVVIDKPQTRGDQDSGWLTERIQNIHARRCRMLRFIDEDLGWVVIADGPAGPPRLDESYSAYRWLIRDTRETERQIRAFVAGMTTCGIGPALPGGGGPYLVGPAHLTGPASVTEVFPGNGLAGLNTVRIDVDAEPLDERSIPVSLLPFFDGTSEYTGPPFTVGDNTYTPYRVTFQNIAIIWRPVGDPTWRTITNLVREAYEVENDVDPNQNEPIDLRLIKGTTIGSEYAISYFDFSDLDDPEADDFGGAGLFGDVDIVVVRTDVVGGTAGSSGFGVDEGDNTLLPLGILCGFGYDEASGTFLVNPVTPLEGTVAVNTVVPGSGLAGLNWMNVNVNSSPQADRTIPLDTLKYFEGLIEYVGDPFVIGDETWRAYRVTFQNITILWREVGTLDWNSITRPVREEFEIVDVSGPGTPVYPFLIRGTPLGDDYVVSSLEFSDLDDPEGDNFSGITDIEIVVVRVGEPSEEFPAHIEGITAGELLVNLYNGVYSARDPATGDIVPTGIRFDQTAVLAILDPVRLRLTAPIDDVRDWAEKFIYKPLGWVPALDSDGNISPVSQVPPDLNAVLTDITNDITEPAPNWEAGEYIVNYLEFRYPRYYIPDTGTVEAMDGIAVRDVLVTFDYTASIDKHGEQGVDYDGAAFGAIGNEFGSPLTTTDAEQGYQLADLRRTYVFARYANGAPTIRVNVMREFVPLTRAGDWVAPDLSWFPDYTTLRRGMLTTGQVIAIADLDCAWRSLLIEEAALREVES